MPSKISLSRLTSVLLLGAVTLTGCGEQDFRTAPFTPTHVARVTGVVVSNDGSPLDSVRVFIQIPNGNGFGYASASALTSRMGTFEATVNRMTAPASVPTPDTVRVEVAGQVIKARYYRSDGTSPTSRESVVLTFVPAGAAPVRSEVGLRITLPPT